MTSDETAIFVLQNNVEEISKTDSCLSRYFNKVLEQNLFLTKNLLKKLKTKTKTKTKT